LVISSYAFLQNGNIVAPYLCTNVKMCNRTTYINANAVFLQSYLGIFRIYLGF